MDEFILPTPANAIRLAIKHPTIYNITVASWVASIKI